MMGWRMLPSRPDYLLLRQDGPTQFFMESSNALLHRGLNELRPQRFGLAKLVASAARQLAYQSAEPVTGTTIVMPLTSSAEAEDVASALVGLPNVDIVPALMPSLFEQLAQVRGRRVVVVVGEGELPASAPYLRFSQTIAQQNPQLEQRFCQELVAVLGKAHGELLPAGFERSRLVLEERPGKAVQLHIAEPTLKTLSKLWQAQAQRIGVEPARHPLAAPVGWGIGGLVLAADQSQGKVNTKADGAVSFASISVRLATSTVQIDTGRILREIAANWLAETADLDISKLRRLVISVPWMAAAVTIGGCFSIKGSPFPALTYPDYLQGWQPQLTALELLSQGSGPSLFLHMGRFPDVHMAARWN